MKAGFGLLVLVIALLIGLWSAKQSLQVAAPASAGSDSAAPGAASAAPRQQVEAVQQQLGKAMADAARARASEAE